MTATPASPPADTATVVALHAATRTFRRGPETVHAVDGADIHVPPAAVTVIAGPSGSGKTTLLNLLIGWEQPDVGRRDPPTAPTNWQQLAVIPQRLGLLDDCSILENVTLSARLLPTAVDPTELMVAVGIEHLADRFPPETSLGEQQRTAIARALIASPILLVADEPTSHQDDVNTTRIITELRRTARAGSAVVIATHDPRVTDAADHRWSIIDGHVRRAD